MKKITLELSNEIYDILKKISKNNLSEILKKMISVYIYLHNKQSDGFELVIEKKGETISTLKSLSIDGDVKNNEN